MFGEDSIPRFQNHRQTDLGVFDSSMMDHLFHRLQSQGGLQGVERDGHSSLGNHSGSLEKQSEDPWKLYQK